MISLTKCVGLAIVCECLTSNRIRCSLRVLSVCTSRPPDYGLDSLPPLVDVNQHTGVGLGPEWSKIW